MLNILIVKIGAIGDVIMALPVVSKIRSDFPKASITWVTGSLLVPVLQRIDGIDKVVEVRENLVFSKNIFVVGGEIGRLIAKIGFKQYDVIINYHTDSRYKILDFFSFSKRRLMFSRMNERPNPIPGRNRAYEHIRLLEGSDTNDSQEMSFPRFNGVGIEIDEEIERIDSRTIVLSPGGAKNTLNEQSLKRWPIENYQALAESLIKDGFSVCIVGANSDEWVLPYFENLPVKSLVGRLSLVQLIQLFCRCGLVVTHDSGPYHLSVFADTPTVIGLFGPTDEREFSYLRLKYRRSGLLKDIVGGSELNCRPCYYGKYFSANCSNNLCMQEIHVTQVLKEIRVSIS